ncbi:MAG: oligosaccharide flippase family protein [Clostridia bacterium]|nr:oligosaccharide flippase family protein [Clostridia bacterium]
MRMKKVKIFILNTLVLLSSSIILQIIGMFFNVYISNKVGSEAVGIFSLVSSVYLFGITLATSGINIATTRVISEELAYNNTEGIKILSRKCIVVSLVTGCIASFIFFIFSDFIIHSCLHNRVSHNVIYTLCLALPFISMSSAINGYFTAMRRVYKNAFAKFFEEFIKIIATAYIINLFLPSGLEYVCFSLILGDVISEILSFIYLYILYIKDKNKYLSRCFYKNNFTYTKRVLRISLPVAFTSYLRSGLSTFKQLLIPSSLEKSGIGCSLALSNYGVVNGMAMPVVMFPSVFINSFSGLLIPEFSRYYVKKDYARIKKMAFFVISVTTIFSLFVNFLLFVFADKISLTIYNNSDIGHYVKILSFLVVFIYSDSVIDSILKGIDAQVSVVFINIADSLITIGFILLCVPHLGFIGYLVSIFISEIFNIVLSGGKLFFLLRKLN